MTGLLLRLAGPLQSWGEHSTFNERDTGRFPTRSGLIGLIASALGRRRTDPIDDLTTLRFTIRIDRQGETLVDFHTVGGGLPQHLTVPTAEGKRRPPTAATLVSRRYYLADAVFTVAVEGPPDVIAATADALTRPSWAPYLGRRSCPAEPPLLITRVEDPVEELRNHLPLSRRKPNRETHRVPVEFAHEHGAAGLDRLELNDAPISFDPAQRRYTGRPAFIESTTLPADLCAGSGVFYLEALQQYLNRRNGR